MLTYKLKYKNIEEPFKEYQTELMSKYSICLHYLYARFDESNGSLSETDLRTLAKNIKGIDNFPKYFIVCATKDTMQIWKSFQTRITEHEKIKESKLKKLNKKLEQKKITQHIYKIKKKKILDDLTLIWGGKDNFIQRQKKKISKEEFKLNRLNPIYSIGEAQFLGNRFFDFNLNLSLTYKPDRKHHFNLELIYGKNQEKDLKDLFYLASQNQLPISVKLDLNYIYISYDETKLYEYQMVKPIKKIQNRVLGIDMNPNYIGWSIVDWKSSSEYEIVNYGTYSFKLFSDEWKSLNKLKDIPSDDPRRIKLNNKRTYEIIKVAQNLIKIALYYHCQIIAIENLNIPESDKDKGKNYNALCNNHWLRTTFIGQMRKLSNKYKFNFLEVLPQYSSFIGNLIFRDQTSYKANQAKTKQEYLEILNQEKEIFDMELSSIEIGRRGYEYYNQYISKIKQQEKNIIQPNIKDFEQNLKISLEILELKLDLNKINLIGLYNFIKTQKVHPIFSGDPNKVRVQVNLNLVQRISPKQSLMQIINHK